MKHRDDCANTEIRRSQIDRACWLAATINDATKEFESRVKEFEARAAFGGPALPAATSAAGAA